LATAKTRLIGFDRRTREALARAFAMDTVTALAATPAVTAVAVVTDEGDWVEPVAHHADVVVLPDPRLGLNAAILHGVDWARRRHPDAAAAVVPSDLPAASPEAVALFLQRAGRHALAVLPDLERIGSTGLTALPEAELRPAFGPESLRRHVTAGAAPVDVSGLIRLRRDVDLPAHLAQALQLGVGSHTTAALRQAAPT